jgi:SAM-dependent methyltransferase
LLLWGLAAIVYNMENARVHDEQLAVGDAFGEILLACQHARGASGVAYELIERSDGFVAVADAARYFSTDLDSAFELARGRVLDIGAGAGRASVALHERGQDVVALDISPGATAVCRDRGVPTTFTGSVFELAASRPEQFDTFLMLGNNLGLLGGPADAPLVLDALRAMAAPRARIVGETADPYTTTRPVHLEYHEQNRASGRLPGQLRLRVRHERTVTPWWDYLLCTPDELEEVIAPTAWTLAGVQPRPGPSPQWIATLLLGS